LNATEPTLQVCLAFLRRHKWLIVTTAVIAGLAAAGASLLQTPKYRASAKLLYTPAVLPSFAAGEERDRAIQTIVGLVLTEDVLKRATGATQFEDLDQFREQLRVEARDNADLITISASATSADAAAESANSVAAAFIDWRNEKEQALIRARIEFIQQQLTSLAGRNAPSEVAAAADLRAQLSEAQAQLTVPSPDLSIVEPARPPDDPYAPHPIRSGVVGFLVGLILGLGLSFVGVRLNRRVRSIDRIESLYGCPTLGVVPYLDDLERGPRSAGLGDFEHKSPIAEAFRTIRTNLSLFRLDAPKLRVVVITSAIPREGKSAAAANLATALAVSGQRVLAISGDVHAPKLHEYFEALDDDLRRERVLTTFGTKSPRGLIDVLAGETTLATAVRNLELNGASVSQGEIALLSNGRRFIDPAVLYQSDALENLLEEAKEYYDVIVIDAPPLLARGETSILAHHADAVVLVARLDQLTEAEARSTARVMHTAHIQPLGLIVTGRIDAGEALGYGYGYEYEPV
jgi:Mrp family chromosome partitioning ATPase/capsular polysaccharide biosynthesis protein